MAENIFKISLRENGEHSIKRSLECYREYNRTSDQMLLKEAIMFLHHGIELLMKEILIQHSEYLIFEDLKELPKKQIEADKNGIGIFFLEKPPKSVTYEVALNRLQAFIKPQQLDEGLQANLIKLNRLRNQIEHYAINVNIDEITEILEKVHKSILQIFEHYLGPLKQLHTPGINEAWKKIHDIIGRKDQKIEEIRTLMEKFNGQTVSGKLFNRDSDIILPKFEQILLKEFIDNNDESYWYVDIFAKTGDDRSNWAVEVKTSPPPDVDAELILSSFISRHYKSIPWIIFLSVIPPITLKKAKELKLMCSSENDLKELKSIL